MFQGSIVALVTPMLPTGEVDWSALEALIDWHIQSGTHGIVSVGTTGESVTLTTMEQARVIEVTVEHTNGRIPVIAGSGTNSTRHAIELTRNAKLAGATASLSVTPYYNKPPQDGLYRHYCEIAEAVDLPIVLYNVPSRTARDMTAETVIRLAEIERIVGIKEACGDPKRVLEIREGVPNDFLILSGEDAQTLEMLHYGAVGTISVTANVVPHVMSQFCEQYLTGNTAKAAELDEILQPLHQVLFIDTNPIPVKWALHNMGRIQGGVRLPLIELAPEHQAQVLEQLTKVKEL